MGELAIGFIVMIGIVFVIAMVITAAILRWMFRIDEIVNQLKTINANLPRSDQSHSDELAKQVKLINSYLGRIDFFMDKFYKTGIMVKDSPQK